MALAVGRAVKPLPDWDVEPGKAMILALYVLMLAAFAFLVGCRCARLRFYRIGREYGLRRQWLRKRAWQRKVGVL